MNKSRKLLISMIVAVLVLAVSIFSYSVFSQTTAEFTIGNEAPFIENFEVQDTISVWDSEAPYQTHLFIPTFRWKVNDNNPDTLTTSICIGTGVGLCDIVDEPVSGTYSPGDTITHTSSIGITLDSGDCVGGYCSRTYYVDIRVNDGELEETNSYTFDLYDNLPTLINIYLSDSIIADSDSCIDFLPQQCSINPLSGDYTSVNAKLTINDIDEDCSALTHSAQLILCRVNETSPDLCDSVNNADYPYTLVYTGSTGTECDFEISVPSGNPAGIEFFVAPGSYKMFIESTSQASSVTWDSYIWEYLTLPDITYTDSVYLGDRVADGGDGIQLGIWNPGMSLATMLNHGNIVLNINWTATDASSDASTCSGHTATCWDLSTSNDLQIDDDSDQVDDTGNLLVANLQETPAIIGFQPIGGLQICDAMTCDSGINETLDTYFHIKPPIGLSPGTYNTELTFTYSAV